VAITLGTRVLSRDNARSRGAGYPPPRRGGSTRGLQDRVLENYEELPAADLALELPTGTAKTLIGPFIAE